MMDRDPGERLLELYSEAERQLGRVSQAVTSQAEGPRPRRIRVSMLVVPEELMPLVRNFAGSRRIALKLGKFNVHERMQTIYTSAEGEARILEAFGEEGDTQ